MNEQNNERKKIIDAAQRLAMADGLFNITVEELVSTGEISEETFYKFFRDIDELTIELLRTRFGLTDENVLSLPIEEKIKMFTVQVMTQVETANAEKFKTWVHEYILMPVNPFIMSDKEILRKLLKSSLDAGELAPDTPIEDILEFIISFTYGVALNWAMTNTEFEPLEHMEVFNNLIIHSLIPYLTR
ncbi:MAG: TetR/AcrR family transcriptional regulator [Synergistaceae bacterium]|nr:TetR/AcrR family transcriptional regulator [Synergistaceae bacterium]